MSVTSSNILVGVGDLLVAGTSVGSTRGGVFLIKELETVEKMVDQSIYPKGYVKTREVLRVRTEVAEATLENIKLSYDVPNSVETVNGDEVLSLGITADTTNATLEFRGKCPEGYERKYYFYIANLTDVGEINHERDGISTIPVTFTVLQDSTKPTGKQLGYIQNDTDGDLDFASA